VGQPPPQIDHLSVTTRRLRLANRAYADSRGFTYIISDAIACASFIKVILLPNIDHLGAHASPIFKRGQHG
jgi:hypothetical protein